MEITDYFQAKPQNKKSKSKNPPEEKKAVEEEEKKSTDQANMDIESAGQKSGASDGLFPPFDEFCNQLASWKTLLKKVIDGKQFQKTYAYCKEQYATHTVRTAESIFRPCPQNSYHGW